MAIAYFYDNILYLAVTRRCTLACTFCPKAHGRWVVAGNELRNDAEPSLKELLAAAQALLGVHPTRHVAFVGLGEPTLRLELVLAAGRALRAQGLHVRLVTDGLANLRAGHDVTPQLTGAIDELNVSLNAGDPATYVRLCPNKYGEAAHAAVLEFIRAAKPRVPSVLASCVAAPGLDVAACERLAGSLGVSLRVRPYFDPLAGEPHDQGTKGAAGALNAELFPAHATERVPSLEASHGASLGGHSRRIKRLWRGDGRGACAQRVRHLRRAPRPARHPRPRRRGQEGD